MVDMFYYNYRNSNENQYDFMYKDYNIKMYRYKIMY